MKHMICALLLSAALLCSAADRDTAKCNGIIYDCDTYSRTAIVECHDYKHLTNIIIPDYIICRRAPQKGQVFGDRIECKVTGIYQRDLFHSAFTNCVATSAEITGNILTIPNNCFSDCHNLRSLKLGEGITKIGEYAFSNCKNLKYFIWPQSLKKIELYAFSGSGLTELRLPQSISYIGESAFNNCTNLTSVYLYYNNLYGTMWDEEVFSHCTNLSKVILPVKMTSIPRGTFYGCSNLYYIDIPPSVRSLDRNIFGSKSHPSNIVIIRVHSQVPPKCNEYTFSGVNFDLCCLYVLPGTAEAYRNAPEWQKFTKIYELPGMTYPKSF